MSASDAVLDEVRRLWNDQLRPAAADRVLSGLSAADRAFLTTVGLPVFEPDIGVASVHDRLDRVVTRGGRQFVVVAVRAGIGRESAVELATGRVYLIDTPEHTRPPELENSGLAQFVLFLGVLERDLLPTLGHPRRGIGRGIRRAPPGAREADRPRPEGMRTGGSWDLHLRDYDL